MTDSPAHGAGFQLNPGERQQCLDESRGDGLTAQRARALLALDRGATSAQAAQQSGLSIGQVRYALTRFKRLHRQTAGTAPVQQGQREPLAAPDAHLEPLPRPGSPATAPDPSEAKKRGKTPDNTQKARKAAPKG